MASIFDGNCSSYWSYSPYSYNNSYDTPSSNSSYYESSICSTSPRTVMYPAYDQQLSCFYYNDMAYPCLQFTPPSPPIVPFSQIVNVPSVSPPLPRPSTNLPNRLQYTNRQRWLLNEIFEHVPYPNSIQKNVVADRIGATREQIRIWFQNRRRIAVQSHRPTSRRSNPVPVDNGPSIQLELEQILADLDLHKNAPQRMPIGQNSSSRRVRVLKR
ncbi:unnamed protein product [Rotaria socialis]|uniref:Homeobox domain-containing protein n=1 Tax=Rotaria socialis TaxID=392032 RepID=A0A818Q7L7_9BILA|nr:unnamed protein product [Rotaria socialis]CAF3633815.1 unnamed protein product [Rotaria socialis]CAF4226074.1 unnamed protein product [Rotaria socialis]CAF4627679.1 unnamed protein product [Rotaria socialis]